MCIRDSLLALFLLHRLQPGHGRPGFLAWSLDGSAPLLYGVLDLGDLFFDGGTKPAAGRFRLRWLHRLFRRVYLRRLSPL